MQYFKRYKQNGTVFYIDEKGNVVSEATARRNLSESQGTGSFVADLSESTKRKTEQTELRARCALTRARLEQAFRRKGMSESAAKIAARGR